MFEELTPNRITEFNGLWVRGKPESCPADHFPQCSNVKFIPEGFTVRDGAALDFSVAGIVRYHTFKIAGQATRKLILLTNGFLYDSLNLITPILVIPSMVDFSLAVYGPRAYISPHNRISGLPGQIVHVYNGFGLARPAGGTTPVGFTLGVATSGNSGAVETGDHLFAIAYETDSGFITRPGPEIFTRYTAPGSFAVDVTNIPIGPSHIVARHLLASKRLPANYNGNQDEIEMFFVEGARIDNNVETSLIGASFFDADLIRSADYLLDQLEQIPAALGMAPYRGCQLYWNENDHPDIIRVSRPFEPESLDEVEGYIELKDDAKGGVRACVEYRQALYMHKQARTYVTEATSNPPIFWPFSDIDKGVGTEVWGVSRIVDVPGGTTDIYALIDRSGIRLFSGTFATNLTDKIETFWRDRVNKAFLNTSQLYIDAVSKLIYCNIPIDSANSPNCILFGDLQNGLSPETMKWSLWTFPFSPTSISLDIDEATNIPFLSIASVNDNIYKIVPGRTNDNNVSIPWLVQTYFFGDREGATSLFGGIRVAATGTGSLRIILRARNNAKTQQPPSIIVTSGDEYIEREFEFQSVLCSAEIGMGLINEIATITEIVMYSDILWPAIPK